MAHSYINLWCALTLTRHGTFLYNSLWRALTLTRHGTFFYNSLWCALTLTRQSYYACVYLHTYPESNINHYDKYLAT